MIMSLATGTGADTSGETPFQVKYDGSIFGEQATFYPGNNRITLSEGDNSIAQIGLRDSGTGEVFLATDKGIISYRAVATDGSGNAEGIYVYPNPVEPGYEGPIAITGLVENANVKITDLNGNLVFETTAQGGTAIWYGKTFGGRDVSSGVYLAFSSDRDGRKTHISKIMIIR